MTSTSMKFLFKCISVVLIAFILGSGSALILIYYPPARAGIQNGAWTTNLEVGSSNAGMYLRAVIARIGLFALNKTATIYYQADTDNEGQKLRSDCDYRIEGKKIDTRWWSMTLYGEDHFLISNHRDRYSYNMKSVAREADGTYRIFISMSEKKGNWLPSGDKVQLLSLSLRCYNPQPIIYEHPERVALPRIIREACR